MNSYGIRLLWWLPITLGACALLARPAAGQGSAPAEPPVTTAAPGPPAEPAPILPVAAAAVVAPAAPASAPPVTTAEVAAPAEDAPAVTITAGDEPRSASSDSDGRGFTLLPAIYYNPDNGLSASVAVLRYFRADARSERSSEIQLEGTVSVRGELGLFIKPTLWLSGDDYMLHASIGAARRERSFFGVGNDAADGAEELYEFRRLSAYFEATRRIRGGWRAGVTGYLQDFTMLEIADGGLLAADAVLGSDGGLLSGVGGIVEYDTRDQVYGPRTGVYARGLVRFYDGLWGSDFEYVAAVVDGRAYFPMRRGTLAVQGRIELRAGDLPFLDMSMAGGKSMLRGMIHGRYRDAHFAGAQVEYRVPVWWRLGAVAFVGGGRVAGSVTEFDLGGWKYSVGAGVRFAVVPKDRINVRADIGTSDGDVNVYLDILEAF